MFESPDTSNLFEGDLAIPRLPLVSSTIWSVPVLSVKCKPIPTTPFCKINLPADALPATIVEPVAYIVPSTSRLYVVGALPTPSLAADVDPN